MTDFSLKQAAQSVYFVIDVTFTISDDGSGDEFVAEPDASESGNPPEGHRMKKAVPDDPDSQTSRSVVTTTAEASASPANPEWYDYFGSGRPVLTIFDDIRIFCGPNPTEPLASFTLFFDVTGDSVVITSNIVSSNVTTSCPISQVFDPINELCRKTICLEAFATLRGSCAIGQNIPLSKNSFVL